ncbi:PspC domain-containing protein [Curtobacterium sp. USHLN213]|uniref:PspC domain-containing protein n=1 Tax=Curtobacterium sp. USHLN213 TaxID=3081255 RepID=UPI0030198682
MTQQDTGGPASATRFFDWIRGIHVTRSDDRWLAGVCGAVAERTGLDPLVVRGVAIVVALLGGPVFLAYAAGWALLPDSSGPSTSSGWSAGCSTRRSSPSASSWC